MQKFELIILFIGIFFIACERQPENSVKQNAVNANAAANAAVQTEKIQKRSFGKTADGTAAEIYTLTNSKGAEAKITDYGATLTSLKMPDRDGKMADVVLGSNSIDGYTDQAYQKANPYFGAIAGRYANRIAGAKFSINGAEYQLNANNGKNSLHGGIKGFDKVFWQAREIPAANGSAVELTYLSKDGEEGFPGNLTVKVIYTLTDDDELKIDYTATTDKETVVNLTHHSYFNLAGEGGGDILGHRLKIFADEFTPIDAESIPTGELQSVENTPFDFRAAKEIGKDINADGEQLKNGNGYDHNFVINGAAGELRPAAIVTEPKSGRVLEVLTTEPGIQLYTGNFLDGSLTGKGGGKYAVRSGFCLETQHFPDSPHNPNFPSTLLKPNETFKSSTVYKFSTDANK